MSQPPVIIAPSILAADPGAIGAEVGDLAACGADWIHVDVMDGSFVPPITFGDNIVRAARKASPIFLDVHLMIVRPDLHIEAFAAAGSNRITVHQEASPHLHRVLGTINAFGIKSGVAINPGTPVESVYDVLELCDLVLIMTVNPGWGGQQFIHSSLQRIEQLRERIESRNLSTIIEVDGGINETTAPLCVAAGAHALVAGSFILGHKNRRSAIETLRKR